MSQKLYDVLGVARGASDAEIARAYRKIAKANHPDVKPGDKAAEERFKLATAAYEILKDKDKRARYDRGEIDEEGRERVFAGAGFGPGGSTGRGGGPGGATYEFRTTGGGFGFDEILRDLFGQGAARGRRGPSPRDFEGAAGFGVPAEDVRTRLEIPFLDAVRGASRRVSLPDGSTVDLKIPSGVESGQVLRLKGKVPAPSGGRAGDLLVEIEVTSHPLWRRSGLDLELEQEVPLPVAVLGGKLRVETPEGEIRLSVPRHSSSGRRLRVKGRGIVDAKTGRRGDLFVRLLVTVPPHADAALDAAVRDWAQRHGIAIGD